MNHRTYLLAALVLVGLAIRPTRAELIIDIGSAALAAGSTKTIDVYISSDAADTAPDMFNQYGVQFLITPSAATATRLEFSAAQSQAFLSNSNYVFHLNSFDDDTDSDASSVATTFVTNDTLNSSDSTSDTGTISLSSADGKKLLAQFEVTTLTTLPPVAGDIFSISLIPSTGTGSFNDSQSTYFDTYDFDNGVELSSAPFRSNAGTITIQSVPEPSALALSVIFLGSLFVLRPVLSHQRRKAIA